jgi:predicted hotdog family 3-hydroxylacyl-ACP dehydratase
VSRTATREEILSLVPHAGAMCLWDAVLQWDDDGIVLEARNHGDATHPLRRGDRLHAVHLCEYGAQAMAVHGGLLARADGREPRPGMLVALREVEIGPARIDHLPAPLRGEATLLAEGAAGCQYRFRILHAGDCIASGRAAVMPRD